MKKIILGSSSPYRKELLQRLRLEFDTRSPDIDETPLRDETPDSLVLRLGEEKARAIAALTTGPAVIIAGDQVAACDNQILGKPGTHAKAVEQLLFLSGKKVSFRTSLCVLNTENNQLQKSIVPYDVYFRKLTIEKIERYLEREPAYNCAGAFKSEGYGISLCEKFEGEDPTALIGLPLMQLTRMLEHAGVQVV